MYRDAPTPGRRYPDVLDSNPYQTRSSGDLTPVRHESRSMASRGRKPRSGVRRHSHLPVDVRLARFGVLAGGLAGRSPLVSVRSRCGRSRRLLVGRERSGRHRNNDVFRYIVRRALFYHLSISQRVSDMLLYLYNGGAAASNGRSARLGPSVIGGSFLVALHPPTSGEPTKLYYFCRYYTYNIYRIYDIGRETKQVKYRIFILTIEKE